jgi:hypothetical protein
MRVAKILAIAIVFLLCVYTGWRIVINRRFGTDLNAAGKTAETFMSAVRDGDFDKACGMTSFAYSQRVGRKGLEELPAKYPALKNVPDLGAIGLTGRRLERYTTRHFMFPRVAAPKNERDFLPVTVKMTLGNDGDWKIADVVVYD